MALQYIIVKAFPSTRNQSYIPIIFIRYVCEVLDCTSL